MGKGPAIGVALIVLSLPIICRSENNFVLSTLPLTNLTVIILIVIGIISAMYIGKAPCINNWRIFSQTIVNSNIRPPNEISPTVLCLVVQVSINLVQISSIPAEIYLIIYRDNEIFLNGVGTYGIFLNLLVPSIKIITEISNNVTS